MIGFRHILVRGCRGRNIFKMIPASRPMIKMYHEEFTKPFDNLPFRVTNRYVVTSVFCILFGVGWWAPWIIVWYSMAKRTM